MAPAFARSADAAVVPRVRQRSELRYLTGPNPVGFFPGKRIEMLRALP